MQAVLSDHVLGDQLGQAGGEAGQEGGAGQHGGAELEDPAGHKAWVYTAC